MIPNLFSPRFRVTCARMPHVQVHEFRQAIEVAVGLSVATAACAGVYDREEYWGSIYVFSVPRLVVHFGKKGG